MTDLPPLPGLPEPPDPGNHALPAGTYDGKVVMVTGGGTGLGKAIATEFARLGASLVVASRKDDHLAAAHEALDGIGGPVVTVICDIRDADQVAPAHRARSSTSARPTPGPVVPASPTLRRPRPASRTWSRPWRWSGGPTGSR